MDRVEQPSVSGTHDGRISGLRISVARGFGGAAGHPGGLSWVSGGGTGWVRVQARSQVTAGTTEGEGRQRCSSRAPF